MKLDQAKLEAVGSNGIYAKAIAGAIYLYHQSNGLENFKVSVTNQVADLCMKRYVPMEIAKKTGFDLQTVMAEIKAIQRFAGLEV